MKIRHGFVSNSSSTSFITIKSTDICIPDLPKHFTVDRYTGHTEFGWEIDDYYDFGSKVIFAYLQVLSSNNLEWFRMLEKVIYDNTSAKSIRWLVEDKYDSDNRGYIDHQSSADEGENTEIFDSNEVLKSFLFGDNSFIHTDNDNH